jgi:hypothetical protein
MIISTSFIERFSQLDKLNLIALSLEMCLAIKIKLNYKQFNIVDINFDRFNFLMTVFLVIMMAIWLKFCTAICRNICSHEGIWIKMYFICINSFHFEKKKVSTTPQCPPPSPQESVDPIKNLAAILKNPIF